MGVKEETETLFKKLNPWIVIKHHTSQSFYRVFGISINVTLASVNTHPSSKVSYKKLFITSDNKSNLQISK